MKRHLISHSVVYLVLFSFGVAVRSWLDHSPNFGPVAAIALFAGYFFSSKLVAVSLPLAIMGVSDQLVGGYEAPMMLLVHAMLAFPVVGGILLKRMRSAECNGPVRHLASVLSVSLASSCAFFLITNFGSWLSFNMYEQTLSGLVHCYTNALPFFRHTLEGDLGFTLVLFGGHAAYSRIFQPATDAARAVESVN